MATTVALILEEVNENLQTAFTVTQILKAVQWVLNDLSRKDMLVGTETTQTLAANDKTLDFPDGFRAMVAITLTNTASGAEQDPLRKLRGGHEEYRRLRYNDVSVGIPYYYSRFNKKFYLWRPSDTNYTTLIEYYKDHAVLADATGTIEFDDTFTDALNSGTTYRMAMQKGRTRMINTWGPDYFEERTKKDNEIYRNPRIVRGL